MSRTLDGGCLCGAIRYRLTVAPLDAGWCHCRLCQRSTGAPAVPWGTWPSEALRYTQGTPRAFASSAKGRRFFCAACGTQLVFRVAEHSKTLDVTLASLDDPAAVTPEYHIWTRSQVPWVKLHDDLPRHEGSGPDTWE